MEPRVRVLHLDDNPLDLKLVSLALEEAKGEIRAFLTSVLNKKEYLEALSRQTYDIILSDYRMPGFNGEEALKIAREQYSETPFIMLTGELGEERAIETLKRGASDYVLKDNMLRLVPAMKRALEEADMKRRRRETEQALRESEERYHAAFANPNFVLAQSDADARYVWIHNLLPDVDSSQAIGKRDSEIDPSPEAKYFEEMKLEALRTGETLRNEVALRRSDGLHYFDIVVEPRRNEQGELVGVMTAGLDVTSRREIQQALERSEQRLQELIRTAPTFIYEIDFAGPRFTSVNDAMCIFSNLSREELLAADPFDFLTDESKARFQRRIQRWLHGEKPEENVEYQVRLKDGREVWVILNVTFTADENGRARGATVIGQDITERRRAEEKARTIDQQSRDQAAMLQAVLDAAPAIIWTTFDPECRQITGNRAAREFSRVMAGTDMSKTGPAPEKLQHYRVFSNGAELAPEDMPIQRVATSGIPLNGYSMDFHFDDGTVGSLLGNVTPILDANGESRGAVAAFMDITELRRAELKVSEGERTIYTMHQSITEILQSIQDPLYVVDHQWHITYVNDIALEVWKKDRKDVLFSVVWDLFPEAAGLPQQAILHEAMRNRKGVTFESWAASTRSWVEVHAYPTASGGLLITFPDIAERKTAQERIADIARFPDENPLPVLRIREDGVLLYHNPAAAPLLSSWNASPGDMAPPPFMELMKKTWAEKRPHSVDVTLSDRVFAFQTVGITERGYVNLYGRDITDQRQAEEAITRLNDQLEERIRERTTQLERLNRELESFSYSVSHDLKAPLRAIEGYAHLLTKFLQNEDHAEKQREFLSLILSSAAQMKTLIDSLLTFSRITRQVPQRTRVDMRALAEQVIREQEHLLGDIAARVEIRLADLPPFAGGDPVLLRQVFANLISNAFKFTRKTAAPVIEIGGYPCDGKLVYFVRDNGAGFPSAHAGKLFQVFRRLHGQTEFEGTGIGLASVRKIIERHGGTVDAEGAEGMGATFSFTLPDPALVETAEMPA